MKRVPGSGTIDCLPSGKFRARMTLADGSRESLGTFETDAKAKEAIDAAATILAKGDMAPVGGITLKAWGERWLDRRERVIRDSTGERNRWKNHIATAPFAGWPLASIRKRDVREWVDMLFRKRTRRGAGGKRDESAISHGSVHNVVMTLKVCLRDAVEDELIRESPAVGLRFPKASRTKDPWRYLEPEQQIALLNAVPEQARPMVGFAIGTMLRKREQWNLHLADVHVDADDPHVVVRFGTKGGPTKGKRVRRVPLFGLGLESTKAQIALLAGGWPNPHRVLFPSMTGCIRDEFKVRGFAAWKRAAGIDPSFRWHDLRHTGASSLVAGWWGTSWSLEQIMPVMGHASITTTQRYAHLAPSAIKRLAKDTHLAWSNAPKTIGHAQVTESRKSSSILKFEGLRRNSGIKGYESATIHRENKRDSRSDESGHDLGVTDGRFPLGEATANLYELLDRVLP